MGKPRVLAAGCRGLGLRCLPLSPPPEGDDPYTTGTRVGEKSPPVFSLERVLFCCSRVCDLFDSFR